MTTIRKTGAHSTSNITLPLTRRLEEANHELMKYAQDLLLEISEKHASQVDSLKSTRSSVLDFIMGFNNRVPGKEDESVEIPPGTLKHRSESDLTDALDILLTARLIDSTNGTNGWIRLTQKGKDFVASLKAEPKQKH